MTGWKTPHFPLSSYCTLMACCLVALDNSLEVCLVGVGETLSRSLAKLVLKASEDQEKTACGNLQLYVGLEAGREGETHNVG